MKQRLMLGSEDNEQARMARLSRQRSNGGYDRSNFDCMAMAMKRQDYIDAAMIGGVCATVLGATFLGICKLLGWI